MAWANLASVEYSDDDKLDRMAKMSGGMDMPDYPSGLQFSLAESDLAKAGITNPKPGDKGRFSAMGTVTGIFQNGDGNRIELEIEEFAGEDGKFFDLSSPAHICLCDPELAKMGLEADCERGDTIHLLGTARVESCSSTEFSGETACLQIVELSYEDESAESRGDA